MLKVTRKLKATYLLGSDDIVNVPEIKNIKIEFKANKEDFIIPYNSIVITEYFNLIQTNKMCTELFFHINFEKINLKSLYHIEQKYVETVSNVPHYDQYMLHTHTESDYYARTIFDKYKKLGNKLGFHISN